MSDVNNNPLHPNSIQASELNTHKQSPKEEVKESESLPVVDNLDNSPRAFLGRSQVKKFSFEELNLESDVAKNIKQDVATFKGNPNLVKKSNIIFENKLGECIDNGDCDAYQKAVEQQTNFVEELKR